MNHSLADLFDAELTRVDAPEPRIVGPWRTPAQMLAEQPEFHSQEKMRDLLELTERRDVLTRALRARHKSGVTVTIGGEHLDPKLSSLTLVTSTYERNGLSGVLGVMGPTRMPYEKIVAIVEHTSRLIGELHR